MRYFNQYFDFCRYETPKGYLEYFRADKQANVFNEEFYLKIYILRSKDMGCNNMEGGIFNGTNTSQRLLVYNLISDEIKGQIADIRLFFMGVVSPSVYSLMHLFFENNYIKAEEVIKQLEKNKEEDMKIIPEHLKDFFEKSWHDDFIEQFQFTGKDFQFVSHSQNAIYTIKMKNAKVKINDGTLRSGRIEWDEIFYHNHRIELNFLTFFSDISIEADDVEFEAIYIEEE